MYRYQLNIEKANKLRQSFIDGSYNTYSLAKQLKVSTVTTWRYKREFENIKSQYPDRLKDFGFYPEQPKRDHWSTPYWDEFSLLMPVILAEEQSHSIVTREIWEKYAALSEHTYKWKTFKYTFVKWVKQNVILTPNKYLDKIAPQDLKTLKHWRHGNDHRLWQISKVLTMALQGASKIEMILQTDTTYRTIRQWLEGYKAKGLSAFDLGYNPRNHKQTTALKYRKERLLKLIHETPKLHGLNRTSWSMLALTGVYNKLYTPQLSYAQICFCVHQMGYGYKKTREMLTSPDPKFREKIKKIQKILQKLKPDEKFFSIDEYGPVSIKIKGGRTLKHATEAPGFVPEKQKAKGIVICTAALELSTNQVTHFFSDKKNTFEMIKLIEVLVKQYHDQETLFLCWDAVSWHNSNILKSFIEDHNLANKPVIKLAPLPASTQFLNVIESVFGGLAKAVIHNSDYACVDECKIAIDQHFATRNGYFKTHPKRAGRKIWGKEVVRAKFRETQNCRKRAAMKGATI